MYIGFVQLLEQEQFSEEMLAWIPFWPFTKLIWLAIIKAHPNSAYL